MRKGLFLGALLATMMIGGTAFAERNDTDGKSNRGHAIKEQVLAKQKEGFRAKVTRSETSTRRPMKSTVRDRIVRTKGEIYGDQAMRSSKKSRASQASGKNMSASGRVNTPAEVRAMMRMINPLAGAYRTSQAAEGTDSYGGSQFSRISAGQRGPNGKNRSATSKINTPAEIKRFMKRIAPMKGSYSTCAAAEGADSYSDTSTSYTRLMKSGKNGQRNVHFKNDRGQVIGAARGTTDRATKSKVAREKLTNIVKEKMAKAKESK